jgi:hypothetical protein
MENETNEILPLDTGQIDLNDVHEVSHWCKELGVSEDELRDAVGKVGPSAAKVRKYLNLSLSA